MAVFGCIAYLTISTDVLQYVLWRLLGTVCDVEWGVTEGVVARRELGRTRIIQLPWTKQTFK